MSLTIQKTTGKTPGELHDDVKRERDDLLTVLRNIRECFRLDMPLTAEQNVIAVLAKHG